jgi:hypothetical protein
MKLNYIADFENVLKNIFLDDRAVLKLSGYELLETEFSEHYK